MKPVPLLLAIASSVCLGGGLSATETENHGISIIPAAKPLVIDGAFAEWDLSGGVFVCSDVENLRGRFSSWLHLMYDKDNLYVLARWNDDTPMNNPGLVTGDMGFVGDCLQLRLAIAAEGEPVLGNSEEPKTQRTTHITAWRGRDGKDVIDLAWGKGFNQGGLKDAKTKGGAQAFVRNADGKGYVQELAIPWSVLAPDGWKPEAGKKVVLTVEPNYGTDSKMRVTTKDIFKAGIVIDRVFTFGNGTVWGNATFADRQRLDPTPVRISDGREFPVRIDSAGQPVIDWGGLYAKREIEGFATLPFTMPEDGYVSLNVRNAQGQVVRQLLNAAWFAKGEQSIKWDGLTNMSYRRPGEPVAAGSYTWDAIWHKGLGLRLVGWASNGGKAPFDSPGGNWGGDMGVPAGVTTTGDTMLLGWSGAEAGAAVVCTDLDGIVKWRHKRGGFGGAALVAVSDGIAYIYDAHQGNMLYRLKAADGTYTPWVGTDDAAMSAVAGLPPAARAIPGAHADGVRLSGLDAAGGKLWLTFGPHTTWGEDQPSGDVVQLADPGTGKVLKTFTVAKPGDLEIAPDGRTYVLSDGTTLLRLDPEGGTPVPVISGLVNARALAIDASGNFYIGLRDPANQVQVFSPEGKSLRTIGKAGGRPLTGPWEQQGMRFAAGMRIDPRGRLWVMEGDSIPKRISVWDAASGAFVREFFGPTAYGAGGGAISPEDPRMLIGHSSEWRIDPETGTASCVGVIDRRDATQARLGRGPNGHLYAALGAEQWSNGLVSIYERMSPGVWKLRTELRPTRKQGGDTGVTVWADANGDSMEQPDEVKTYDQKLGGWITGWYMPMTQSMIFYGQRYRLAPVSWTACGAPVYDPTASKLMPGPEDAEQRGGMSARIGCGSEDGKLMVYNGLYGAEHGDFQCWDIERGTLAWSYPNNFIGVHGGHGAPPPAVGMIRGAYDLVGSVKLPDPIGDLFVVGTDKGEWHLLTGSGYYLSSLFQPDGLKVQWPDPCIPGAIMDNTPPGMGAEDFGGAIAATKEGELYIQAGKTAFIDLKVVGIDAVKKLANGSINVSAGDLVQAAGFRQALVAGATAVKGAPLRKATVAFTGDVKKDFADAKPVTFTKSASQAECSAAYDATTLYLGWSVANDATPWVNGATEPAVMYAKGDTVDFQLGTDPTAEATRPKAVAGDLRLSIGDPQGTGPVAVLYRPLAGGAKSPRKFYSGTVKDGYEMESVEVLKNAKISVHVDKATRSWVVEAAIPLADLGLKPSAGTKFSGDFGVTYGNPAGDDTVVRSHWSNQATDFVADEVWELVLEPRAWGVLTCE